MGNLFFKDKHPQFTSALVDRAHLNRYAMLFEHSNDSGAKVVLQACNRWRREGSYEYLHILYDDTAITCNMIAHGELRPALERIFIELTGTRCQWSLMMNYKNTRIFYDLVAADKRIEVSKQAHSDTFSLH